VEAIFVGNALLAYIDQGHIQNFLQVLAIEFVLLAIDFIPLANEFILLAIEFIPFAIEFVTLAFEFVALAWKFVHNKIGSWSKHENKMLQLCYYLIQVQLL